MVLPDMQFNKNIKLFLILASRSLCHVFNWCSITVYVCMSPHNPCQTLCSSQWSVLWPFYPADFD